MNLRIMVSRHSAFYSPLIAAIGAGFLADEGLDASYAILGPGQRSQDLIREGVVDVMQSAVSSNWKPLERGESPLPVHFAQINRRDGFFLVGRNPDPDFAWKSLQGKALLADHGGQPLAMLKYAAHLNGVDWAKVRVIDAGTPEEMSRAFASGTGDYAHFQAPSVGVPLVSVGRSMPEVAFSSLCASREFVKAPVGAAFLRAYRKSREWVRAAPASEVAGKQAAFFPGIELAALADAIGRYQDVGCWDGSTEITRDLYQQSLDVFEYSGGIGRRHAYQDVCVTTG